MDEPHVETTVAVDPRLVSYTHAMYALHAAAIITGILSMVFVITPFAFGAPSLVAMIMNLGRRNAVRSTWLDSHFRWQLETLIIAAIVVICVSPFIFTFVLNPLIYGTYVATGLWAAWRIARGWLALKEHRLAPTQRTLI